MTSNKARAAVQQGGNIEFLLNIDPNYVQMKETTLADGTDLVISEISDGPPPGVISTLRDNGEIPKVVATDLRAPATIPGRELVPETAKAFITATAALRVSTLAKTIQVAANESILANKLQEIIREALKGQVEASSSSVVTYEKPYTQRIELMRMPANY
ncbi:hypothetical protein CRG98_008535 [Punica granatum]|uniref:Uncharacterized protein n=1 Tax=Punica granatum TaxID=22663 RepID=A0A2I0KRW4_PUNGR|nr:hypothetical protein CRG98_008535 [Punica granatum]